MAAAPEWRDAGRFTKPDPLSISGAERAVLDGWAGSPRTPQSLARRAGIVLACAEGRSDGSVADDLGVCRHTVRKWRARFTADRLAGLGDASRCGGPRQVTIRQLERVLSLTLLPSPGQAPPTTRALAEACRMSQSAVSRASRGLDLRSGSQADRAHRSRLRGELGALRRLSRARRPRSRVRVHRVECRAGLRDWLAARDAEVGLSDRADLILTACDPETEVEARAWVAARRRFVLHVAPPGPLWAELVAHWFPSLDPLREAR